MGQKININSLRTVAQGNSTIGITWIESTQVKLKFKFRESKPQCRTWHKQYPCCGENMCMLNTRAPNAHVGAHLAAPLGTPIKPV